MGRAKNGQIQHEEKVQIALSLCVDFGAARPCPVHTDVYLDNVNQYQTSERNTCFK